MYATNPAYSNKAESAAKNYFPFASENRLACSWGTGILLTFSMVYFNCIISIAMKKLITGINVVFCFVFFLQKILTKGVLGQTKA